jgi:ribose-phosphate pyrophosphokinase
VIIAKHIIGDVEGKNVLMVDDMITTAGTMSQAVQFLKDHGARDIYIAATHGVFAPPALDPKDPDRLPMSAFTKLAVTDTIPIGNRLDAIKDRAVELSVAELIGEAIHRIHHNESVSALFDGEKQAKK